MITEPNQADQIIAAARLMLFFLAREMLRDPSWPFARGEKH